MMGNNVASIVFELKENAKVFFWALQKTRIHPSVKAKLTTRSEVAG